METHPGKCDFLSHNSDSFFFLQLLVYIMQLKKISALRDINFLRNSEE